MEPSLDQIEDYDGKESKSKKRTVYFVVLGLILFGVVLDAMRSYSYHQKSDIYIPTVEKKQDK